MTKLAQLQANFCAHIRNPEQQAAPANIEQRRLRIYRELFYNNIEGFAAGAFPVLRSLIDDDSWHQLVRQFMVEYRCHTPLFLEISQEFLNFLQTSEQLPVTLPFMQELAHYEWLELALDIDETDLSAIDCSAGACLMTDYPVVSPLAWVLAYQYPVHLIGVDFQPQAASEHPHYLIVYRNRSDAVQFMEANAVTARLLALLQQQPPLTGEQALQLLGQEMQHPNPEALLQHGQDLLQQLCGQDILLGARR